MRTNVRLRWSLLLAVVTLIVASASAALGESGGPTEAIGAKPGAGDGAIAPNPGGGSVAPTPGRGDPGCGIQTDPTSAGPNGTISYNPCPGDEPGNQLGKPTPVQPRPGMADLHPIGFDHARVAGDDRTVTIVFWSGVEPCYVLDHFDVTYGEHRVTVTLYEGHDPSAGDVACIEIAQLKSVTITLDEPLAGRTIVDGAA